MCGATRDLRYGPQADILSAYNGVDRHVETEMEQFGSGLVAGISVPNTPIIADELLKTTMAAVAITNLMLASLLRVGIGCVRIE
jgi:hypothetical protein